MPNSVTCEIGIGSCAMLLAAISIDDPALKWLERNGLRVALVGVSCSFLAFVTCLLIPASTIRLTIGRILAAGTMGSIVAGGAGSIWESGTGPAATAGIIVIAGIGGWLFLVGLYQYLEAKKNNNNIDGIFRYLFKRFFGLNIPTDSATADGKVADGTGTDGKQPGNSGDGRPPDNRIGS